MRLLGCMFWVISVVETKDGAVSVASAFAGYQEGRTNNLLLLHPFHCRTFSTVYVLVLKFFFLCII